MQRSFQAAHNPTRVAAEQEKQIEELTRERDRAVADKKEVREKLEKERKESNTRIDKLEKENEELKKKASDVSAHTRQDLTLSCS